MARASGCSLARSTLAASRSSFGLVEPSTVVTATTFGRPSVSVPVLSTTSVSTCLHALQRLGVLDQHAGLRAAADADHDRHRRRKPERAGTGDDQHRDRGDQPVGQARLRAERRPGRETPAPRPRSPTGTNQPETWSARRWIGARERCAAATICTICASMRVAADLLGAHHEAAAAVDRAGDHLGADLLASPASIRRSPSIRRAWSGLRSRRRRPAPSRRAARAADRRPRRLRAAPPRRRLSRHAARGLRREIEQRADRARGLLAGAQLQHLTEQHQHGDDGGRLEIDRDRAVRVAERRRKQPAAQAIATTL